MVAHSCNPSPQEAEAGGSRIQGQLHSKAVSKTTPSLKHTQFFKKIELKINSQIFED
jgi:hypothetical protein